MSSRLVRRRGRALASLGAAAGLALGAVAATGTAPPAAAAPAADCTAAYPQSELSVGQAVNGLTVVSGTTPTSFTGEVLGVLKDGIAPGLDMIMMDLDAPEFASTGGIWQGMSGSPVYAADGRLIGAVAYGLAYGPSPIAGVTPFDDMDDYLASAGTQQAGRTVKVPTGLATRIAQASDVTRAQAAQGVRQLPVPMGISGISGARLQQAAGTDRPYAKTAYAAGSSGAAAVSPDTIVAGGNVAASVSYGDITSAGIGTATSVCNGRVVGFGHPFSMLGTTTLTLHPADALYVQPDSLNQPFKVANLGAPAGTITDDHLTGITGSFGAAPRTATVSSTVAYRNRSRTGTSQVSVQDALADTTFFQNVGNHDRVLDAVVKATELQTWSITGTDETGAPFSLGHTDRFSSADISFDSAFELADLTYGLSAIPGVKVDSVAVSSQVADGVSSWKIKGIQQKRGKRWVTVGPKKPARVEAGSKLRLRVVLGSPTGSTTVPVSFRVPKRGAGSVARVYLTGGSSLYTDTFVSSLAQARKRLAEAVRNDEIQAVLSTSGGSFGVGSGEGGIGIEGRGSSDFSKTRVVGPASRVVDGGKRVKVVIE